MQQQQFALHEQLASGKADDAAVGKAYNLKSLCQQMSASGADAEKQMDAVLTKSQREQLLWLEPRGQLTGPPLRRH